MSFREHDGRLLSGAVAFHALLALAPFGVIGLAVAGRLFGEERAQAELRTNLTIALGPDTGGRVVAQLNDLVHGESGFWASLISAFVALLATMRFFHILQIGLNHVWGVRARFAPALSGPGLRVLQKRMVAFVMVLAFSAVLLALLFFKVALAVVASKLGGIHALYRLIEVVGSFALFTVLLWAVYRWLPDARILTRDILPGATVTAFLAAFGSFVFGYYLTTFTPLSSFGALGTAIALLLWFFYSAQIFFLGAAMIGVWARHRGKGIEPLPHAARLTVAERHSIVD